MRRSSAYLLVAMTFAAALPCTAGALTRGQGKAVPAERISFAEIADLFSQAKQLFRQGNELARTRPDQARRAYQQAAVRFERIVRDGGVHNGRLFYNIGNTCFRMNDLGRAILWYRRAQALIPNDPNLRQNLSYARTRRIDQVPEEERQKVLKTLFFWHYDFAARTRLLLFIGFFDLLWVGAGVRIFVRRGSLTGACVVAAAAAVMMLASLTVEAYQEATAQAGVIVVPEVIARKGDGNTYEPSFKEPLHAGTEFTVIEPRRDWRHVRLANGRSCWIPTRAGELIALAPPAIPGRTSAM